MALPHIRLAALHLVLLAIVIYLCAPTIKARLGLDKKPFSEHYENMLSFHLRGDGALPPGRLILIGDSLIQGLPAAAVSEAAVNYGIGGDTTLGLLNRLPQYHSIESATAVFIAVGVNDMRFDSNEAIHERYLTIVSNLPPDTAIFCSSALPIDEDIEREWQGRSNERYAEWNTKLEQICTEQGATYVPAPNELTDDRGQLNDSMHIGDGLHLNAEGNAVWAAWIKSAIQKE